MDKLVASTGRRWRRPVLVLTAVIGALLMPSMAYAGQDSVLSGQIYTGYGWLSNAPRHSLTAVTFSGTQSQVVNGYATQGCVNALNADGSGWAGTTYCYWPATQHPYCGCQLRYGYGAAFNPPSNLYNSWVTGSWTQNW